MRKVRKIFDLLENHQTGNLDIAGQRGGTRFLFSCSEKYFTNEGRERVKEEKVRISKLSCNIMFVI